MKAQNKPRKSKLVLAILLVVLCAGAGTFIYKQHQKNEAIAKERAQYAQAEKDLDVLTEKIITKLGQPDDQKKVKECGHTSAKLRTGLLFCEVREFIYYPISDQKSGDVYVSIAKDLDKAFSTLKAGDGQPSIASSSYYLGGLSCISDFSLHTSTDNLANQGYTDVKLRSSDEGLLIELSCGATHPRAAYYNPRS